MTPVALAIILAAIAGLIFVSALFSGLETALFSLRPHQLRRLEENHPALSDFVQLFRDKPRRVLNVLLLGDGLVKVPLVVLCPPPSRPRCFGAGRSFAEDGGENHRFGFQIESVVAEERAPVGIVIS